MNPLSALGLLLFGIFLLFFGGASAGLAYVAYRKHRRYKLLGGTPLTPPGRLKPGLAKTAGRVVGMEEPLVSPMTRRECVFYDFKVEEQRTPVLQRRQRGTPPERYWVTIVHDRQATRFFVEDESGEAEIDVHGGEVTMKATSRAASGTFNTAPPELKRVLRDRYGTSTRGLLFDKVLRYSETVIEEGDRLIVLGEVGARKREKRHILGKGDKVPLLASDRSDGEMANSYARSRNWWAVGAAVPALLLLPIAVCSGIFVVAGWGADRTGTVGNNAAKNGGEEPPPGVDLVAGAVQDLREGDPRKREAALKRLKQPPGGEARRQLDEARADPARRKEVAHLLVDQIRAGDNPVHVRQQAMALTKDWVTLDLVPDLIDLTGRADDGERILLARALSQSKDARAVPALVKLLKGTTAPDARAGLEQIASDPEGTRALAAALDDPTAARETVCYVLAKAGTAEALPALQGLKDAPDRRVRSAATAAVKAISDRRDKLARLDPSKKGDQAETGDPDQKELPKDRGKKEGAPKREGPDREPPAKMDFVARALQDSEGKVVRERIAALRRLEGAPADEKDRQEFEAALADPQRRKGVAKQLIEMAKGKDGFVKRGSLAALKAWVTPDVVPELLAMLERAEWSDGRLIVAVLGASKDGGAVPALLKQAKTKSLYPQAVLALEALGPSATKELVAALDDEAYDRRTICAVLGKVGTAEALPALEQLAGSDTTHRADARIAITRIKSRPDSDRFKPKDEKAENEVPKKQAAKDDKAEKEAPKKGELDFVGKVLRDANKNQSSNSALLAAFRLLQRPPADEKERKQFEEALADEKRRRGVGKEIHALSKTTKDYNVTMAALAALKVWVAPDAVPDLIGQLDKATLSHAWAIIQVLGASKDERAVPALLRQMKRQAPAGNRLEAGRALEQFGPSVTKTLLEALKDEKTDRKDVCRVLGAVGTAEALPALEKLLHDEEQFVRSAAKVAIYRIKERDKK